MEPYTTRVYEVRMSDKDKEISAPQGAGTRKSIEEAEEEEVERQLGELDVVAERKLVRKLDIFLIPTVMLLYLFSFLDR